MTERVCARTWCEELIYFCSPISIFKSVIAIKSVPDQGSVMGDDYNHQTSWINFPTTAMQKEKQGRILNKVYLSIVICHHPV